MPHLQLDTTYDATDEERRAATAALTELYTDEMRTTDGHVAVTVREHPPSAMSLGRAVEGPLAFLNADVRRGRSFERKRAFALGVIEFLVEEWGLPRENTKVVYTEHAGEEMMGADRVGGEWADETP